jgi:hypothetical protein
MRGVLWRKVITRFGIAWEVVKLTSRSVVKALAALDRPWSSGRGTCCPLVLATGGAETRRTRQLRASATHISTHDILLLARLAWTLRVALYLRSSGGLSTETGASLLSKGISPAVQACGPHSRSRPFAFPRGISAIQTLFNTVAARSAVFALMSKYFLLSFVNIF